MSHLGEGGAEAEAVEEAVCRVLTLQVQGNESEPLLPPEPMSNKEVRHGGTHLQSHAEETEIGESSQST